MAVGVLESLAGQRGAPCGGTEQEAPAALVTERPDEVADALEAARQAVAANPRDEAALARLAASCRLLIDPVGAAAAEAAPTTETTED